MKRQLARQILAFAAMAGFIGISAMALLHVPIPKFDLVYGTWSVLVTKVMSDYFSGDKDVDANETHYG
jgi:hypothetical protein